MKSDVLEGKATVGFKGFEAGFGLKDHSEKRVENPSDEYQERQVRNERNEDRRKTIGQGAAIGIITGGGTGAGIGATIGAIVGSVVPGPGTLIGATVGATIGGICGVTLLGGAGGAAGAGIAAATHKD